MNKPLSGALLCALFTVAPAGAQTYRDNPTIVQGVVPIPANIGGVANGIAVSTSSSATNLPATASLYPSININNAGSVTAYVQLGASTTTSAGAAIPAGGNACLSAGQATQLAAITASSTTTLNITQANACIQGAGGGGGGGGTTQSDTYGFNGTSWSQVYLGTGGGQASNLSLSIDPDAALLAALATPIAGQASGAAVPIGATYTCDGANTANPAAPCQTVKAASTAPALTDKAAVVALSSNGDPCIGQKKTNFAVSTASGNLQIAAGVASQRVYVCSIALIGATAWVGNLIEGTGAACITSAEAAVIGSTTAANGMSFAANGGMTYGNGGNTVASVAAAANGLCLLQSGTAQVSGNITFVQQ